MICIQFKKSFYGQAPSYRNYDFIPSGVDEFIVAIWRIKK